MHRFNHPFIRPHVHAPVSLTMRAGPLGPSDRTRSRRVVSCVRGVADLTEGVVAPVRLGPLSPHHVFLSFSILLLINFACARARVRARASAATDLSSRQRLASTIAVCDGRSSSFLPLFPSFVLVFLLLFSFFHFPPPLPSPPLARPHPGLPRSYPTYCPFRSNPGCVAGSKRNYSYLPPTLSDSRLFRGSRPSHHPPPLSLFHPSYSPIFPLYILSFLHF